MSQGGSKEQVQRVDLKLFLLSSQGCDFPLLLPGDQELSGDEVFLLEGNAVCDCSADLKRMPSQEAGEATCKGEEERRIGGLECDRMLKEERKQQESWCKRRNEVTAVKNCHLSSLHNCFPPPP